MRQTLRFLHHTRLLRLLALLAICFTASVLSANAAITITPATWNVVGLDSNNVNVGPSIFPIGARVCNTAASPVTNISASFVWDSTDTYINLNAGTLTTVTYSSLAANACVDYYFDVIVTRTSDAYYHARGYHISAAGDGVSQVSTPTPREIYVEKLVSQNRNSVVSVVGPTTVYQGSTYQYTITADTSTNGYEQIEAFLGLSNVIFKVIGIATTYSTGGTNDKFYADGCGWINDPASPDYRSCTGTGKNGGVIVTTYTVLILSTGVTQASTLIHDFSGSSYHYNSDFGAITITITSLPPPVPNVGLTKSVSPAGAPQPGADLTYSIAFSNTGTGAATNFRIIDPNPSTGLKLNASTEFKVGSVSSSLGTTGLTANVAYSNDDGSTFTYVPVSGAGGAPAGYDGNVTHIRWTFSGSLSQTAPNNTGSVSFVVRVK
jgi:uncharacterized repeat protein (TIGR01451 family)